MYYLKQKDKLYFKGFDPVTKDIKWTGCLERAAFWNSYDCAEDQAFYLNVYFEDDIEWIVAEYK